MEQAQKILNAIVKDIFGVERTIPLELFAKNNCTGIPLPEPATCVVSGKQTWIYDQQPGQRIISPDVADQKIEAGEWFLPKQPINSMDDLFKAWERVNYMGGEKIINSKDVSESDSVTTSSSIYRSSLINSSKNIIFSNTIYNSNFVAASKGSEACNYGIRMFDSLFCSSGYEIRWSNKVSRSLFITDSYDLFECMFCYSLRSKKYCIANMQFEKEEYFRIKEMVIQWLLPRLG